MNYDEIANLSRLCQGTGIRVRDLHDWFCWGPPAPSEDRIGYEAYLLLNSKVRVPYEEAFYRFSISGNDNELRALDRTYSQLPKPFVSYIREKTAKNDLVRKVGKLAYDNRQWTGLKKFSGEGFDYSNFTNNNMLQLLDVLNHHVAQITLETRRATLLLADIAEAIASSIKKFGLIEGEVPDSFRDVEARKKFPNLSAGFRELGKSSISDICAATQRMPRYLQEKIRAAYLPARQAEPAYKHNLRKLTKTLVATGRAVGLEISIPPERCWAKDSVTGRPVVPRPQQGDATRVTYRIGDEALNKRFPLSSHRSLFERYLTDLTHLLMQPDEFCTHTLENGSLGIMMDMSDGLEAATKSATGLSEHRAIQQSSFYRTHREYVSNFFRVLTNIGNWGCAAHFVEMFGITQRQSRKGMYPTKDADHAASKAKRNRRLMAQAARGHNGGYTL